VYLHGSLAMGSFYRPKSDLDLLVVTDSAMSGELHSWFAARLLWRRTEPRLCAAPDPRLPDRGR
jgi:predicted nucleotidyltransferase